MPATVIHREDHDTGQDPFDRTRDHDEYGRRQRQRNVPVLERHVVKHGTRENGSPFLIGFTSTHYKGLARSGKQFSRWATESMTVVDVTQHGAWLVRGKAPKSGWNSRLVFAESEKPRGRVEPYLHLLGDEPVSMWDHYPTLGHYIDPKSFSRRVRRASFLDGVAWGGNAEFRRRFIGAPDAHTLTRSLFGARHVRRDLVKAVAQTNLPSIYLAWQFRGLVPTDWLVAMMRDDIGKSLPVVGTTLDVGLYLRPQFRALDLQSLRNLTRDPLPTGYVLRDLSRMHRDVSPRRVRGWHDLHDALDQYRRTFGFPEEKRNKPKRPIKLTPEVEAIEGTTAGGLTVEIARHEQDLWNWGLEMKHCIGGYGPQMRSRESILGAIRDGAGQMVGNFEIGVRFFSQTEDGDPTKVRTLNQMLGKQNSSLPDAIRRDMEAHLKTHDVTCNSRYWGAAERPAPQQAAIEVEVPLDAQVAQAMHADGFGPGEWEAAGEDDLDDDFLAGMEAFEQDLLGHQQAPAYLPF